MNAYASFLTPDAVARALGGDVHGDEVHAPGPGHSPKDRSMSVKVNPDAPDGFVVNSFAPKDEGDFAKLRDYVNERLGRPKWTPNKGETAEDIINRMSEAFRANPLNFNNGPKQKRKESKPKPRIVAIYVYKDAKGEPYLRVRRTSDKQFWQSHWTSTGWATGKPQGPKIPYRLPKCWPPSTTRCSSAKARRTPML